MKIRLLIINFTTLSLLFSSVHGCGHLDVTGTSGAQPAAGGPLTNAAPARNAPGNTNVANQATENKVIADINALNKPVQQQLLTRLQELKNMVESDATGNTPVVEAPVAAPEPCELQEVSDQIDDLSDLPARIQRRFQGLPPASATRGVKKYRQKQAKLNLEKCKLERDGTGESAITSDEMERVLGVNLSEIDREKLDKIKERIEELPEATRDSIIDKLKDILYKNGQVESHESASSENSNIKPDKSTSDACDESSLSEEQRRKLDTLTINGRLNFVEKFCEMMKGIPQEPSKEDLESLECELKPVSDDLEDLSDVAEKIKRRLNGLPPSVQGTIIKRYRKKEAEKAYKKCQETNNGGADLEPGYTPIKTPSAPPKPSPIRKPEVKAPVSIPKAALGTSESKGTTGSSGCELKSGDDESDIDERLRKRISGLPPGTRSNVINRFRQKQFKKCQEEGGASEIKNDPSPRKAAVESKKIAVPEKKPEENDAYADIDPAFLKKIQRFSPAVRKTLIKRHRAKKAKESSSSGINRLTQKPQEEPKKVSKPLVTEHVVSKEGDEFNEEDLDPKLRRRLEGLPPAQRAIVMERLRAKAKANRQGALNKDDPISSEVLDEWAFNGADLQEVDAILEQLSEYDQFEFDLQDLIPDIDQIEEQCSDPFVAIEGHSAAEYLEGLIENNQLQSKVESVDLCTRLCLQRNGLCTAYEYNIDTSVCSILNSKPELGELSPDVDVIHYQLKPICVGKDRFLIPDVLTLTIGNSAPSTVDNFNLNEYTPDIVRNAVVMQRTEGFQPPLTFGRDYTRFTEEECVDYCLNDLTPQARDRRCYGLEYQPELRKCTLLAKLRTIEPINPDPQPKPGFISYEKVFISEDSSSQCRCGFVTAMPQRVLIGFDQQIVSVGSYDECVDRCFHMNQQEYVCMSGTYYTGEKEQNCILSFEDHWSQPRSFLIVEAEDLRVEYFALDTCIQV